MRSSDASLRTFIVTLVIASFSFNWLWEMIQMGAYVEMAGLAWSETILRCAFAALGDLGMTLAIYGLGCLAAGQWRWGMGGGWNIYLTGALLGAIFNVAFEWKSQHSGRWSYNERMPIVPVLEVGLWPLAQLTLLVPICFTIAAWWTTATFPPRRR